MLPRIVQKVSIPRFKLTAFKFSLENPKDKASFLPIHGASVLKEKMMPTPQIDVEFQEQKDASSGNPRTNGQRRTALLRRRKPWFQRQWNLEMRRVSKGPETPHFPDGVPFTLIRTFKAFAGRNFKVNVGRRRKVRFSLKRGRRKLLK